MTTKPPYAHPCHRCGRTMTASAAYCRGCHEIVVRQLANPPDAGPPDRGAAGRLTWFMHDLAEPITRTSASETPDAGAVLDRVR